LNIDRAPISAKRPTTNHRDHLQISDEQHRQFNLMKFDFRTMTCLWNVRQYLLSPFAIFSPSRLCRQRGAQVAALRFTFHFCRPNFPCSLQNVISTPRPCGNPNAISFGKAGRCRSWSSLSSQMRPRDLVWRPCRSLVHLSSSPAEKCVSALILLDTRTAIIVWLFPSNFYMQAAF